MSKLIMVVEDSRSILEMFETLLIDEGYQVSLHSSPSSDLAAVKRVQPDLIIVDLIFGNEPVGVEFIRQMGLDPATSAIPLIVCSAQLQLLSELAREMPGRKMATVSKPFDIDDLLATIKQAIGGPESAPGPGETITGC